MKTIKVLLVLLLVGLFLLAVVPLIVPVPPLQGTQPLETLADADSRFIVVNGIQLHYKQAGVGEPVMILLHGFGASIFSWHEVLHPLAQYGTVIAYDRPAFGLSARPMPDEWAGENPYAFTYQDDLLVGLMDALQIERAILVGNSAGGTVAVSTALEYPERVTALVLVDAAIYQNRGVPTWIDWFSGFPQVDRWGGWLVRRIQASGVKLIERAWHDPGKVTPDIITGYRLPLKMENWDRALWELTKASGETGLALRLKEIRQPVLVLTGDDDHVTPTENSVRLSGDIPGSGLVIFKECGHVPQEECPQLFLEAIGPFLQQFK